MEQVGAKSTDGAPDGQEGGDGGTMRDHQVFRRHAGLLQDAEIRPGSVTQQTNRDTIPVESRNAVGLRPVAAPCNHQNSHKAAW
jgi:hypothetical protein